MKMLVAVLFSILTYAHDSDSIGNSLENSEVIELNDRNFEHLTQASTGATTGDWFVYFYDPSSAACTSFSEQWLDLHRKVTDLGDSVVNIAKVNAKSSPEIIKRFEIKEFPSLIYFRLGLLYTIRGIHDSESLFKLVEQQKYKEYASKKVSPPPTFLDSINLNSFYALPLYVHALWVTALVMVIASSLPKKLKTN